MYLIKNSFLNIDSVPHTDRKDFLQKDFYKLQRLLQLDHPTASAQFMFETIDLNKQSMLVKTDSAVAVEYFIKNGFQVALLSDYCDPQIMENLLAKILKPGQSVVHNSTHEHYSFIEFEKWHRGYLDDRLGIFGVNTDFSKVKLTDSTGRDVVLATSQIHLPKLSIEMLISQLPLDWKHQLPPTFERLLPTPVFLEGDVVSIVDESHLHFKHYEQCLVFRLVWDTAKNRFQYKIRLPSKECVVVEEEQIALFPNGHGVVRLFRSGEPIRWRDLKSEAEFHLLLGKYGYCYNLESDSYSWTKEQAMRVINHNPKAAHGYFETSSVNYLVTFQDPELGERVAMATSNDDLILRL